MLSIQSKERGRPLNNFYQSLHGWFDYKQFYKELAEEMKGGETFVEVGVWAGKSLIYFLSALESLNKLTELTTINQINVYAVDTWNGTETEPEHAELITNKFGGDLYGHFLDNIERAGFTNKVKILRMDSIEAAKSFNDKTVDFCFLDGNHTYEGVTRDIEAWWPKIASNGILAGHDFDCESVRDAVFDFFGEEALGWYLLEKPGHVWYVKRDQNLWF